MIWDEFKTNIDTLPKYITYVKKNIKILAPIQGQYKDEILDAIGSINIKTYKWFIFKVFCTIIYG